MAISENHILENTVVHMEAYRVLAPQVQSQVAVRIRFAGFDSSTNTLSILQETIHRFHMDQIPLPRALPTIVSSVVARMHGVHATILRLCNDLLSRLSSQVTGQIMAGSALEVLVHIGVLLRPGGTNQDIELMTDWMLENPPREEEMAGDVYDYFLYDTVDAGHGGAPASRSFLEGLQRSPYGRGDGVREEECVICLEVFDARAEVSKMPCSHAFHSRCIIRWLEMSSLCPICRSQMPTASSILVLC